MVVCGQTPIQLLLSHDLVNFRSPMTVLGNNSWLFFVSLSLITPHKCSIQILSTVHHEAEFLVFVFTERWNLQSRKETSLKWMIFKNQLLEHPLEIPVISSCWRVWSYWTWTTWKIKCDKNCDSQYSTNLVQKFAFLREKFPESAWFLFLFIKQT